MATRSLPPGRVHALLAAACVLVLLGGCGGYHSAGITITEGADAVGEAEPERGVPPHVAPRLDTASLEALDDFIQQEMLEHDIPGLALGIVSGANTVHLRGFGVADGRSRPITPDTPFLLAEPTGLLTAIAALQLVEDGLLDLDAPVRQYLPWFTTATGDSDSITVRQLLHHRSGFSERTGLDQLFSGDTSDEALETHVRGLGDVELANLPGTYEYSNINYDILGLLVQTVSQASFEEYVSRNVLDPLEMRHSHQASDTARADGMAEGFYRWFGAPAPTGMPYSRALAPSVMTISTVEDLSHLLVSQLNAGEYAGARVLTADSTQLMQTPDMYSRYSGIAAGWQVRPLWDAPIQLAGEDETVEFRIPTILEVQGNYPTYESYVAIVPEGQWGVVMLVNTNDQLTGRDVFPFQSVLQLILGEQVTPTVNTVPVLARNLRWILLAILVLLVASATISWFRIRRWRQSPIGLPEGPGAFVRFVALPLVVDLAVFYVLVFLIPARLDVSPWVALRGAPDVGLLVALIVVMTVGWGITRTVLTVTTLYRKKAVTGPSFRVGR